jgi:hypothetical protein
MTNTELLTEPELTPILEAYFETKRAYEIALDGCGWSMSLESYYRSPRTETDFAERIAVNTHRLTERAEKIALALELGQRFGDFVAMGIEIEATSFEIALYRYQEQQRDIADAPRRAWSMAYNARLAEIDKQIKSAKIRRGKTWSKWRKNAMPYETALMLVSVIDLEIAEIEKRREIIAAETFESVAA